ncbi:hypothetical protein FA13DRAFT_1798521 [Coprinellus micaceus]|uniref:DUF6532 domain-containing protein n=1 Tax=Coprinellus micaceus TaxID=71717 RepID=A0A4Y7SLS6_COPMI|nr:hypothetical protein FA13DRAFT_1798521 [Coprinellus micaceus]
MTQDFHDLDRIPARTEKASSPGLVQDNAHSGSRRLIPSFTLEGRHEEDTGEGEYDLRGDDDYSSFDDEGSEWEPTAKGTINAVAMDDGSLRRLLFPTSHSPRPISAFSQRLSALNHNAKTGLYTFNNTGCQHGISEARGASINCAILDAFQLRWSTDLESFVDIARKTILLPRRLRAFIVQWTESTAHDPDAIVQHLLDAYPLKEDETDEDLRQRFATLNLKSPITYLPDPVLHHQCPICMEWVCRLPNHHHRKHQGQDSSSALSSEYFLLPLGPGGGGDLHTQRSLKVRVVANSAPAPQGFPEPGMANTAPNQIQALSIPVYVHTLGWSNYLQSCGEDLQSVLLLVSLVRKGSGWLYLSDSPACSPPASTALDAIENFLPFASRQLQEYLSQANGRIQSSHISVRELVTHGGKGMFRQVQPATRVEYASFPLQIIALALRWVVGKREKHSSIRHLADKGWSLGWKGDQQSQCEKLVEKVIPIFGQNDKDSRAAWDQCKDTTLAFLHGFFSVAFTEEITNASSVHSMVDQALLFSSFSPASGWRLPQEIINGPLKSLQYLSRAVLAHCAYLGGLSSEWKPHVHATAQQGPGDPDLDTPVANAFTDMQEDMQEQSGRKVNQSYNLGQGDDMESDDESDGESDLDFDIISHEREDVGSDAPPGHEMGAFFQEAAHCFKALDHRYQWGRCSAMWSILLNLSQDRTSPTKIDWNVEGKYNFSFQSAYANITLDLYRFYDDMQSLPRVVWQAFTKLFPSSYPEVLFVKLSGLALAAFADDISSDQSLFERPDNMAVFSPFQEALVDLWSAERPTSSYVAALTHFQAMVTQAITMQNGVSLRAFQLAGLKIAPFAGLPRNVYVDEGRVIIGRPEAKQKYRSQRFYESYWLLEDQVGLAVLLYAGLFHKHSLKFGQLDPLGGEADVGGSASLNEYPYLFLKVKVNEGGDWTFTKWDGADVNSALRTDPSPLKAEARVHRHFTKAIIRRYLSDRATQIAVDNPLDDELHADSPQNVRRGRDRQLALSTAMHELLGLRPSSEPKGSQRIYEDHGVQHARHIVRYRYQLCGSGAPIRSRVAMLQSGMPFLKGDEDRNGEGFGDQVLVETAAAVIYGPNRPPAMQPVPFRGYSTEVISVALTCVWSAIHEWSSGTLNLRKTNRKSFLETSLRFQEKLTTVKAERRHAWIAFCHRVHLHASAPAHFSEPASQLYLLPQTHMLPFQPSIEERTHAKIPRLCRDMIANL